MKKVEIAAGINLWLIPDGKFKTYYAGIHLHAPLSRETATENALLPLVLKRGNSEFRSKREIAERLDMLMGANLLAYVTKRGEEQMLSFTVSGVSDSFAPFGDCFAGGLELMFKTAFSPLVPFKSEYIEGEKKHLSELIESEKNDKRIYAGIRARQEMCKGDSYAVPENGYASEIGKITPKSLEERYFEITKTAPIDIVICGSFDADAAVKYVHELSTALCKRDMTLPVTTPAKPGELPTVTEQLSVSQGKLCVGFTTGEISAQSPDFFAMLLYNSIFGGGAHSKLFLNVREKLSLAYYASSVYERAKGIILVSSGIETKNFEATKNEIIAQYREMTDGNIKDTELDVSKKSLINSYLASADSVVQFAAFNLAQIMSGTPFTVEETVAAINKVNMDDVLRVAQNVKPKLVYFLKGADR